MRTLIFLSLTIISSIITTAQDVESVLHIKTWVPCQSAKLHESDGYIYLVLSGCDSLSFGDIALSGQDSTVLVVKMTANFDTLWTQRFHGNLNIMEIKTDIDGNVVLTGQTYTVNTVSCGNLIAHGSGFIARLNSQGDPLWLRAYYNFYPTCIEADCNHDVLVAGQFSDSLVFNNQIFICEDMGFFLSYQHALMKIEADGNEAWFQTAPDVSSIETTLENPIRDIAIDNECNIWLSGTCGRDSTVFGGSFIRAGNILLKYSTSGDELYFQNFSNLNEGVNVGAQLDGLAVSANGDNVFWVTYFTEGDFITELGQVVIEDLCDIGQGRAEVIFHFKLQGNLSIIS